jgi:hypothetical protein
MKLIIFDKKTQCQRSLEPSVRFTKSGSIYLNKGIMALMQLQVGNSVSLAQDEERKKDWYIFRDADGLNIRNGNKKGESFLISNATAAFEIKKALGLDQKKNFSVKIANTATEENGKAFFALLTSKIS